MKNRGITLIALMITIIILLILAGITISLIVGDNGILNRASEAGKDYSEQAARERLELALANLGTDKITNSQYNETNFIDDNLTKEGFIVNGDIVLVDGWLFEIDRTVPKIANSLGKGKLNPSIILVATSNNASDYTSSTIQVTISYPGTITSIILAGEEMAIPAPINGVYTVSKNVTVNGSYGILVKDENGDYKTEIIKITDIAEDMDIYNKVDLEAFRDKVNKGATFKGRTIRVMADIDLQGSSSNPWTAISIFNGNFNGNYHKISNIYINNALSAQGLFSFNYGTIEGIILESGQVTGGSYSGSIVGNNIGTIKNCSNAVNVSVLGANGAGGITGHNTGIVEGCVNKGNVYNNAINAGGITSYNLNTINNCYNIGNIQGNTSVGGITGNNGDSSVHIVGKVQNCYSTGTIKGNSLLAGISAGSFAGYYIISNNYWLAGCGATYGIASLNSNTNATSKTAEQIKTLTTTLGTAYAEDTNNSNNGYPILKWELGK